jgi:hypothetical protein
MIRTEPTLSNMIPLDEFWWFCEERERVRLLKEAGKPRPWTSDEILDRHKFTNIDRLHDRGTVMLGNLVKDHDNFETYKAICIYRFSGSNANNITLMEKTKPAVWFDALRTQRPLFNNKAYQANWGHGKGRGINFILNCLSQFVDESYPKINKPAQLGITEARDIMCEQLQSQEYLAMRFQTTEIAKDLSAFTPFVDKDSACPMNLGAIKGLRFIFEEANKENVQALVDDPRNPNYNTQVLEHALCEYSKYWEFRDGTRGAGNKIYKPTEIKQTTLPLF